MQYESKGKIIQAEQFFGNSPMIIRGICDDPKCFINIDSNSPHVHTMHNNQPVQVVDGDWIVPEPNGKNFYPVKDDVFKRTYRSFREKAHPDCGKYRIGDEVKHPSDLAAFVVIAINRYEIQIEGDFSGGTHNVCQRDWVKFEDISLFKK